MIPIADITDTADAAYLLVSESNFCGIANFDDQDFPSGLGKMSCNILRLTFHHELAHMFGAQHNIEISNNPTYDYAYGYLMQPPGPGPSGGYRTIMA